MHLQSLSFRSLAICIPKPFIFHPGTPKGFLGSPESKINYFFSQVIYQTLKCTSMRSTQSSLHQLTNSTFCVSRYLPTFLDLFQRFGGKFTDFATMKLNMFTKHFYLAEEMTTEWSLECSILVKCVATLFSNVSMMSTSCLY